jgi:hypothetical protein
VKSCLLEISLNINSITSISLIISFWAGLAIFKAFGGYNIPKSIRENGFSEDSITAISYKNLLSRDMKEITEGIMIFGVSSPP